VVHRQQQQVFFFRQSHQLHAKQWTTCQIERLLRLFVSQALCFRPALGYGQAG
jgi:hypothetical protein